MKAISQICSRFRRDVVGVDGLAGCGGPVHHQDLAGCLVRPLRVGQLDVVGAGVAALGPLVVEVGLVARDVEPDALVHRHLKDIIYGSIKGHTKLEKISLQFLIPDKGKYNGQ